MKSVLIFLFCSLAIQAQTGNSSALLQWQSKMDSILPADPDFLYNDANLDVINEQTQQTKWYLVPQLNLFHTSQISKGNTSFKNSQYGLNAQVNLFQFGRSHYKYLRQNSILSAGKLEHRQKRIENENKYLTTLFKSTLLKKKFNLYTEIENLKRKALKVAQQRYNRGNLPRQQVDKVEIDLSNLSSQRITIERDLLETEVEILKYQLGNFKREWPFTQATPKSRKTRKADEFVDVKILDFKSIAYENQLEASHRNYMPTVDLSGRSYLRHEDQIRTQEWDVALRVSWPLWDNYSRSLENLNAYRDFHYWQTEKSRVTRDWENRVRTKEEQLDKLAAQLNQSVENLKKLNTLYADTESLFSQGRITVNELFQDQQLLLETQINYENELYAFHEFILGYCSFYSERVWECFPQ